MKNGRALNPKNFEAKKLFSGVLKSVFLVEFLRFYNPKLYIKETLLNLWEETTLEYAFVIFFSQISKF